MSFNIYSVVSRVRWSMMGISVGSWYDGIGRSMTINAGFSSDDNWELISFILGSTSSRNGGSTSLFVWFSTGGNGGY